MNFQNLLTDLESLDAEYNPANGSIINDKLKDLGIQATKKTTILLLLIVN